MQSLRTLHIFFLKGYTKGKRKSGESMKKETIYLKLEQDVKVPVYQVTVGDVAAVACSDATMSAKIKVLRLFTMNVKESKRQIISVTKVIDEILKEYPELEIQSIGEMDCIVEYIGDKKRHKWWDGIKILFVSLIVFFGAGFGIMTFNEDVSVSDVFSDLYKLVYGQEQEEPGLLELTYSLGLTTGIILFYNHIGGRRITKDPTPLEVQMRVYEQDVNQALIETANRKGELIDVD